MAGTDNLFENKWEDPREFGEMCADDQATFSALMLYLMLADENRRMQLITDDKLYLSAFEQWRKDNQPFSPIFDSATDLAGQMMNKGTMPPKFLLQLLAQVYAEVEVLVNGDRA